MQTARRGLGAQHVGGADLHAGRAERLRRGHAARIGNAAGGDDGHAHRAHDLRQQREGAHLRGQVVAQEVAAVAAGLQALRDDRVDAARLQPQRLIHRGGGGEDLRAPRAHVRQQLVGRQAEMKAHHRRLEFAQQFGRLAAEGHACCTGGQVARIEAELAIVRRQCVTPGRVACGVRQRVRVAEEVDVVRPAGPRPQRDQLVAQGLETQHRAGQRAEPAGVGDGDGQRAALHAGHRGLDQGQLGAEQRLQRDHAILRVACGQCSDGPWLVRRYG